MHTPRHMHQGEELTGDRIPALLAKTQIAQSHLPRNPQRRRRVRKEALRPPPRPIR